MVVVFYLFHFVFNVIHVNRKPKHLTWSTWSFLRTFCVWIVCYFYSCVSVSCNWAPPVTWTRSKCFDCSTKCGRPILSDNKIVARGNAEWLVTAATVTREQKKVKLWMQCSILIGTVILVESHLTVQLYRMSWPINEIIKSIPCAFMT